MFAALSVFAVVSLLPVVLAQTCPGEGCLVAILQALNSSGLDQFVNITASLNSTSAGQAVISQLSKGNSTIFAPTDDALRNVDPAIFSNDTTLAALVSYHVVPGNFINQTQPYPNVTIGRTLLNDSGLVMLEGNQSQVIIWSKYDNGTLFVSGPGTNVTVLNTTTYNDTAILTIGTVLNPPVNISTVLNNTSNNLTATASFLNSTGLPNGPSLLDVVSSAHGITIFAPNDAGVQAAQGSLSSISSNKGEVLNVFLNHIINGTSAYSTELTNGSSYTSAGGEKYAFTTNSTGLFVSVGGSNQVQVVEPDLLVSNGVIHVVDGVMLDTNSNAAAASSAYAAATSVAAHTTETGAIAGTATSPSQTHTAAAKRGADSWKVGALAGVVAGLVQAV